MTTKIRSNASDAPFERLFGKEPHWELRRRWFNLVGFAPNEEQEPPLRREGHRGEDRSRYLCVTGGEQSGKSLITSKDAGAHLLCGRLGWVVGPDYRQCRPEMEYLAQDLARVGLLDSPNTNMPNSDGPWRIRIKGPNGGILVRTLSGQDTAKIANEAPDYIAMVEAGQLPEEAYHRCMGRTAPRRGSLFINGTLEGSTGWFPELADRWKTNNPEGGISFELPSWSNRALYPGGYEDPEIQKQRATLPEDVFLERFGGQRTPPRGLVFREFDRFTHVRPIQLGGRPQTHRSIVLPEDIDLQVWVDPGFAGGYAVLFAAIHQDVVYIVDEIFTQQLFSEQVIQAAIQHPYWQNVTHCIMDIAGEQHHSNESAAEIWRKLAKIKVKGEKIRILDGIERMRSFLFPNPITRQPRMFLNDTCTNFIWELSEGYKYHLDRQTKDIRSELPKPKHNHACNAAWYGLVANFGIVRRDRRREPLPRFVPVWERKNESVADRIRRDKE